MENYSGIHLRHVNFNFHLWTVRLLSIPGAREEELRTEVPMDREDVFISVIFLFYFSLTLLTPSCLHIHISHCI